MPSSVTGTAAPAIPCRRVQKSQAEGKGAPETKLVLQQDQLLPSWNVVSEILLISTL